MKKISLVVMFGLLIGLTACGGNNTEDETKGTTSVQVESDADNVENTEEAQADSNKEDKNAGTSVAENFKYTEENGEITITGYDGEATVLNIPDSINGMPVVAIGKKAFANTEGIENVIFPDSVTLIGSSAFEGCGDLIEVTFGANLEVIDNGAFWRTSLIRVEFPEKVHTIGDYAFDSTRVKEVTIPSMVTVLGIAVFGGSELESVTVPGNVKEISEQVFRNCNNLRTVVVEEGVEIIGEYAFGECKLLESVTLPASLTALDDSVVSGSGQGESVVYLYVPAGSVAETVLNEKYPDSKYFKVITQ